MQEEIKRALAQIVIGLFFGIALIPIIFGKLDVHTTEGVDLGSVHTNIGETIWISRLPEIYFHVIFLAATIIASVLVIRRPPELLPEETLEESS